MKKKRKKVYLPKYREYEAEDPESFRAYSRDGSDYTELPNPSIDPIVANNIAYQEFDYTDMSAYEDEY